MYAEFMKMFEELQETAQLCYYKAEVMCGYCENRETYSISSGMFLELISEIRDIQNDVMDKIDEFTTKQDYELYRAKTFHPDCNNYS